MSLQTDATPDTITRLADLLNDAHPDVRNSVRNSLRELDGQQELTDAVRTQTVRILAGADWRGLEQAARLAGELDHEPAGERLVELLPHERMEVQVTAAWSLRELAVAETLPGIHEFAEEITGPFNLQPALSGGYQLNRSQDACLSYLFEAVGQAKFAAAAPVLLKFVPKRFDQGPMSRSAAVWALGHIFAEDPPDQLVGAFIGRMGDSARVGPEYLSVREAAAVGLGRMKIKRALEPRRTAMEMMTRGRRLWVACEWAIAQITNTEQPETPPLRLAPTSPFLRSIRP